MKNGGMILLLVAMFLTPLLGAWIDMVLAIFSVVK